MSTALVSVLAGLAGMIGWGLYDFLGGVYSKRIGPYRSFFWSQVAGMASVLVLVFFLDARLEWPSLVGVLLPIASVLYSAGYLFFFKGLEKGNIPIVAATMNLWAVFTMVFAFIFLGQRLTPTQSFAVMLILSGVTLASSDWGNVQHRTFRLSSGVKEAILGAFFFGVFWNISEVVSEAIGWQTTTLLVKVGIVLFLLPFSLLTQRELAMPHVPNRTKAIVLTMGVVEAAAVAAVNYGLTIGDAILITPIASALSIVTIGLAVVCLRERVTRLQGIGILAAIAGIILTAF